MKNADLVIAVNTVWVVLAAVLVMFMQAGFAFLEAGLTRMKNAAHIAGKNVLIFGVCSIVYWAVGFGLAFGSGNGVIGTSGFFPSADELLSIGAAPFAFFTTIPASAGYLFEVVFAGVSLAMGRDGRAGEAVGLRRVRRLLHDAVLGRLALDLAFRRLALLARHAGLRGLYRRALSGRPGRAGRCVAARPPDRQVRPRRSREPDPLGTTCRTPC